MLMAQRLATGLSAIPPDAVKLANASRGNNSSMMNHALQMSNVSYAPPGESHDYNKLSNTNHDDDERMFFTTFASSDADPSLIFAMERTYFSALNQGVALAGFGVGLMSIGPTQVIGKQPESLGVFLLIGGLLFALSAFVMHAWRMSRLNAGLGLAKHDSLIWCGTVATLLVFAIGCEVYYGLDHPYVTRSGSAEIMGGGMP
jgi:uncharacterized membrane protein YidH (DUF202 family)